MQIRIALLIIAIAAGCQSSTASRPDDDRGSDADQPRLARATLAPQRTIGEIELIESIPGPMPTGIAVSRDGRIFMNFPRWGDPVEFTVAELRQSRLVPFPDRTINRLDPEHVSGLVSVQSVVIDSLDRLWILDTGSVDFQPIKPQAAKLICVDLNTNRVVKTITFPQDVALPTTYLNDVRFDLSRGNEGMAFITDWSDSGPNGIIVVDLASGESWRRLNDHPSTKADTDFIPTVEGRPLMIRQPGQPDAYLKIGADGIAIDPLRKVLYFCPLASRRLHSVSLDALTDRSMSDRDVAEQVQDLGTRQFASDGLECDGQGRLYLTDYEHNAIQRRDASGNYEIIAQDPRMIWPDSIAVTEDGFLYFTVNQLNRQARFHHGGDMRQPPYAIFRVRTDVPPRVSRLDR